MGNGLAGQAFISGRNHDHHQVVIQQAWHHQEYHQQGGKAKCHFQTDFGALRVWWESCVSLAVTSSENVQKGQMVLAKLAEEGSELSMAG